MGLLLLVRHGQASFGADDYDVLSPAGWEQARALGRWLAERGELPVSVVHGGMRRHRETWEGIVEGCRLVPNGSGSAEKTAVWDETAVPDARIDEDWAEFDHLAVVAHHGRMTGHVADTGQDRRAFQEYFELATGHWACGEAEGYPEPYADFVARARAALLRAAELPGPTLVVSSGGVIAALAATLVATGLPPSELGPIWSRFNTVLANSSVSRVIVGSTGARLLTYNEHTHLSREEITYR